MTGAPFLYRFRQRASTDPANEEEVEEFYYCLDRKLNVTREGRIFWSARTRRFPTSCYTKPRKLKAGWTRGKKPKYKPAKWTKGKTDRRAGK